MPSVVFRIYVSESDVPRVRVACPVGSPVNNPRFIVTFPVFQYTCDVAQSTSLTVYLRDDDLHNSRSNQRLMSLAGTIQEFRDVDDAVDL